MNYYGNLTELTTLDSFSKGMPYTQARRNEKNNYVINVVVAKLQVENKEFMHFLVILNNSQGIILSSDGVIDLVCSIKFKSFFKSDISVK